MNQAFRFLAVFSLISLVLLGSSYAQALETVYKQNSTLSIIRPCYSTLSSNGFCPITTTCSLTITDNSNGIVSSSKNMTNQIFYQNLSVINIQNGKYRGDMACQDSVSNQTGSDTFYFGVNDAGSDYSTNYFLFMIIGLLLSVVLIFLVLSYILTEWLRLAFLVLIFLILPVALWFTQKVVENSFVAQNIINIVQFLFITSLIGFIAIILYVAWELTMGLTIEKNPQYGAKVYRDRNKGIGGRGF